MAHNGNQKIAHGCFPIQKAEDKPGVLESYLSKLKKKVMMWKKTWAQVIILECATKCITIYVIEH